MSERVSIDDLAEAVNRQLDEYAGLASDEVKEAVRDTGRSVKADIQEHAPVKTGAYRKSWAVKETSESADSLSVTVHSRTRYRLTHLLEHGHALRNGGRARAFPHIAPAEQRGQEALEADIKRRLEGLT